MQVRQKEIGYKRRTFEAKVTLATLVSVPPLYMDSAIVYHWSSRRTRMTTPTDHFHIQENNRLEKFPFYLFFCVCTLQSVEQANSLHLSH